MRPDYLRQLPTPFNRSHEIRPWLRIVVDVADVPPNARTEIERVVALAEIPEVDVRCRARDEPLGEHDLHVRWDAPSLYVVPYGVVTPSVAIDIARILLVNRGVFRLRRGVSVDETFYYLYRKKSLFTAYQAAWSTVTLGRARLGDRVSNQLSSLGTRLEFLCRAVDYGAHACFSDQDGKSEDVILYHLGYFVMLATGVFDDIAWALTYLLGMQDRNRRRVGLRAPAQGPHHFVAELRGKAPRVAECVAARDVQELFEVFYPIRDALQHREYPRGLLYAGGPWGGPRLLFEFPRDSIQPMRVASRDGTGAEWGYGLTGRHSSTMVDPYLFLTRGLQAVVQIHNTILDAVEWPAHLGAQHDPDRLQVEVGLARYRQSLATFLGWPQEPLYF